MKNLNLKPDMQKNYHLDNVFIDDPIKFGDIYLLQLGRLFLGKYGEPNEHIHRDWFELTVVTDGCGKIGAGGTEAEVKRGDIFLSFPAEIHKITSDEKSPLSYDFFAFYTECEQLRDELNLILSTAKNAESRIISDERIGTLVSSAIAELPNRADALTERLLESIFEQILIYTVRAFRGKVEVQTSEKSNDKDKLCYTIMSYIDTHIFSIRSLGEISKLTNYNYSYISDLFKKTTGRTLSTYYQSARLKAAQLLLREGKLTVGEIAELLGYSSVYVLSRAYKNMYGISPSLEWQK